MRQYTDEELGPQGPEFEKELRLDVGAANRRTKGEQPAPWEVVMEAVIRLERRISRIEGLLRM